MAIALEIINRNTDLLGYRYISGNAIFESGQVHFVQQRSKELGISEIDFLKNNKGELEEQFGIKIQCVKTFVDKFGEYLT